MARDEAQRERGIFSFVEVLLATLVLAMSATATAYWVEMVGNLATDADEQSIALALVKTMEGVIKAKDFRDPQGGGSFGPDAGEQLAGFDDVDDFDGFQASPPIGADLLPQADLVNFAVTVEVDPVDPVTLAPVGESDVLRVRVQATRKSRLVADAWWLRTRSPFE